MIQRTIQFFKNEIISQRKVLSLVVGQLIFMKYVSICLVVGVLGAMSVCDEAYKIMP